MNAFKPYSTAAEKASLDHYLSSIVGDFYHQGSPCFSPETETALMAFLNSLVPVNEGFQNILQAYLSTHTPVPMFEVSKRLNKQIKYFALDQAFFDSFKYTCPFNGFTHCALLPTYYFCKDEKLSSLVSSFSLPMYLKDDLKTKSVVLSEYFDVNNISEIPRDNEDLHPLQLALLGLGYTSDVYPNDGSAYRRNLLARLENGDYLMLTALIWCNK